MTSRHYETDRIEREAIINQIGMGKVIDTFTVDRGHRNGPEVHEITNTGIIVIYNKKTGKMITKLIARIGQIKRYYPEGKAPRYLINVAYKNTVLNNYNLA